VTGTSLRSGTVEPHLEPIRLVGEMVTHVGGVRHNNEDAVFFTIPEPGQTQDFTGALLLVADGMGGHAAGEIASKMAVERVRQVFRSSRDKAPAVLEHCFRDANRAIYQHGLDHSDQAGLGTTCTALIVRNGCAFLGHIGDSRAYLYRNGRLHQLSTDHTLVGDLVRSGTITSTEAVLSPDRNVLLKALGVRPEIDPEIWERGVRLLLDDRLVLCSDGLTDFVSDAQICVLVGNKSSTDACDALLEAALRGGGYDNVSVGVFHVVQNDDVSTEPKPRPTRPLISVWTRVPWFTTGWYGSIRALWSKLSQRLRRFGGRSRLYSGGAPWMGLMLRDGYLSAIRRRIWLVPRRS
jgi:serine/threonine protein phosphatase PrpC